MRDQPTVADPYPWYARLRTEAPVCRVRQEGGLEIYLVTRYEDARRALTDPRLSKNPEVGAETLAAAGEHTYRAVAVALAGNMLGTDPPEHTRLRRLLSAAFTQRRVEGLRPRVQAITDGLLDAVSGRREVDLMDALAFPLPITVICELLGVPAADRDDFRRWTTASLLPYGRPAQADGTRALNEYLAALIKAKRDRPSDDLISALITASADGRLSADEVLANAVLLLIAGHETTVNLIGNGVLALLREPHLWRELRRDPGLVPGAVEELLRYDGPVERATSRFAAEDVEIAGVTVPKGSVVIVALGSADRDPERFPDPDTVDLRRGENPHLAFGHGIHYCLGAPLARMEGQIAIGTLLRRFPDLALAAPAGALVWRESRLMRGLTALPVALGAPAPAPG
ncbi:cytochrome P450 family protein [Gandjariella thermophila]|uniref:Cytochrome P450 hydroxylase n=1 Tax=Gandjariella thermophila TaxID=1931992 RepID=A0A4D4JDU7_9PSEU|nr:cytochrome P450 [Gandjariella thermophila]GDY32077.1 cytochrome P450 hydroxylase [Gandjariella thermophila]